MDPRESIGAVAGRVKENFRDANRLLAFDTWLEHFLADPVALGRSAPQYVAAMLDHFGKEEPDSADGAPRRHHLFDLEFLGGAGLVHGQESVQHEIYRLVRAAADAGRADKLILLHGPNGSGKSVLVEAVFRGLEHYSKLPEGALYRFNWVFPKNAEGEAALGFHPETAAGATEDSFALLPGDEISARLSCEMKDHPIFLVPAEDRRRVVEEALAGAPVERARALDWLLAGDLCQKCKSIYEALLAGYQGDWRRVIAHVQVERHFLSQRYRSGAVTILPMASADAREQQVTADVSMQNLPPSLMNLKLFEPYGDLVEANGGVVEFGDFLKRPMDLNKYLLNAVEKGNVTLPNTLIDLNVVMLGTSNEKHLDAFKTTPDWTSFKGRIELIPVPYILDYRREADLYRDMLSHVARDVHVAPHTFRLAGLFAVLTRLLPPDPDQYDDRLKALVSDLTPMEKADLYQKQEGPDRMERDDRQVLLAGLGQIKNEYRDSPIYEGRFGASAREMKMVLTAAAFDRRTPCLTPALVFDRLRDLVKDRSVYDFLKLKPARGYHDSEAFLAQIADRYGRTILEEFQDAMELIREEEYDRQFDEYVLHVIAFNRGEKVTNPQTGEREDPSPKVMDAIEDLLSVGADRESFRKDLVARIGAYALDHPAEKLSFRILFPDLLRAVKGEFFRRRRETVRSVLGHIVQMDSGELGPLAPADRELAERTVRNLTERSGYCEACARDAAAWLAPRIPEGSPEVTVG